MVMGQDQQGDGVHSESDGDGYASQEALVQEEEKEEEGNSNANDNVNCLTKSAQKKVLKMQRYQAKKAHQKAMAKVNQQNKMQQKRQEWADKLAGLPEVERSTLIQAKLDARKDRMADVFHHREVTKLKLTQAMQFGQNIVLDLEFSELMKPCELSSLQQQIMYCYAVNKRSSSPAHTWLTGCKGEIGSRLQKIPGFDNWLIERKEDSYIEALKDRKDDLVYLTADSDNVVQDLQTSKIYIIGGLVDRNRWKGITMQKANNQGIQTAKLPIAEHLRMTSSQVLTVNQVFEILISYLEFKDWRKALFQVIPHRKRSDVDSNDSKDDRNKNSICNDECREEISHPYEPNGGSKCNEKVVGVTLQT